MAIPEPDAVVAVVAAFRPGSGLVSNVAAAVPQVSGVVVVDDGSPSGYEDVFEALVAAGVAVLHQPSNGGIAAALNAGVREARERWNPEFVVTLDQDSTLTESFVANAVGTYRSATASGLKVGFVSASSYGDHQAPSRRPEGPFTRAFDPMQSGSVVPVSTLDALGGFDEGMFIDGVDSEYTSRCQAAGLSVLVGEGCRLEHALGEREASTFFGRPLRILGRQVSYNYHSPSRVYYITRNGTTLTLRHLRDDPAWVGRRLVEETKAHVMRLVLGRDRSKMLRAMLAGYTDAAKGRLGRIPDSLARRLR